jgi:hypothetical protein
MQSRLWVTTTFSSRRMLNALSGDLNFGHGRVVIPAQSSIRVTNQIILEDLCWTCDIMSPGGGMNPDLSPSRLINTDLSSGGVVNTDI